MREVENVMVVDAHWRDQERRINHEPAVIGECYGCEEEINESEKWLEFEIQGSTYTVHDCEECAYQFVAGMSRFRGGE
jgi:hypothetical protein